MRPFSKHDPTNKDWTWVALIEPLSEVHQAGADNMMEALQDLRTASKSFNASTKAEVSKTVYCRLGDRNRKGIQNMVSVLKTTDRYCEDAIRELNRTTRFVDRMKKYDVGGDQFADGTGFLSARKDDTYSQVWDGHHKDDILIGTGFRGDGSLEPTNVFIASTSTIDACCQKHKDKIKANGGIVSYKGGIHEMDGTRTNRCAPATKCCGSTISLDVGGDNGVWWRAVGAFVRRKMDEEARADEKRLCVEESSTDTDVWPSRLEGESSMDTEAPQEVEGLPTDAEPSHDVLAELEDAYLGEAADE